MQQTLNRISHNPDQPALCDGLSQRANRLADELQRAEFLVRDPALQKPWSIARHDPRVIEYMAAKLKVEMTLPARAGSFVGDDAFERITATRDTQGLRRACDLWCRIERRKRDLNNVKRNMRHREQTIKLRDHLL